MNDGGPAFPVGAWLALAASTSIERAKYERKPKICPNCGAEFYTQKRCCSAKCFKELKDQSNA